MAIVATKSSNKILRIIQLLHLELNITRSKVFGSTVFTLMECIFLFLILKKELIELDWIYGSATNVAMVFFLIYHLKISLPYHGSDSSHESND